MTVNIKKNRYVDSKHFLLMYYKVNNPILNCNIDINKNELSDYYNPINTFDSLLQIEKYITNNIFLSICKEAKIYCMRQLRVLVGIDSRSIKYSINKYHIVNLSKKDIYYFFVENVIYLEEFIDFDLLLEIESKIKFYNMRFIV